MTHAIRKDLDSMEDGTQREPEGVSLNSKGETHDEAGEFRCERGAEMLVTKAW